MEMAVRSPRKYPPFLLLAMALLASCATEPSVRYSDTMFEPEPAGVEYGAASWYHANWIGIGEQTASGERFRQYEMTAAHKSLPFGTFVRVTNLRNGCCTIVRITDRGPFVSGRIIDLSKSAARDLGILDAGVARVRLDVLVPRGAVRREPFY
jgi:rare lipoprotein A